MKTCLFKDSYCQECPQYVYGKAKYCFYHTKLDSRLLTRADSFLSQTELEALFGGRRRSDGRRLDHYTSKK